MDIKKYKVLLIGGGAVGAIAALNLECGHLAEVTAVLRSNYEAVLEKGYRIESVDHGKLDSWRPTTILPSIPTVSPDSVPWDYIVCTTKNCPDITPTLASIISPAVTPSHTTIVLIQNGLNIEVPLLAAFPYNTVLSGVSMIDSHEAAPGHIKHEEADVLYIGAFANPNLATSSQVAAAKHFIHLYGAGGKTDCQFSADVPWARWRKLVFNAALNPICAITRLDDARVRLVPGLVEGLVRPAMREIMATALKLGHELPAGTDDVMINLDPMDLYLKPSMLCDAENGNYLEFENLIGEPMREAERVGVQTPVLRVIYEICKAVQWKTKETKGALTVPPKRVL